MRPPAHSDQVELPGPSEAGSAIKAGWLSKRGEAANSSLKRRYCVVSGDGTFAWYSSERNATTNLHRGTMSLRGATVRVFAEQSKPDRFRFVVESAGSAVGRIGSPKHYDAESRVLVCEVASEEERAEWIQCLQSSVFSS